MLLATLAHISLATACKEKGVTCSNSIVQKESTPVMILSGGVEGVSTVFFILIISCDISELLLIPCRRGTAGGRIR